MIRLVATDLDGTVLGSDGLVSERTRAAFAAVRSAGASIVAVTARGPWSATDILAHAGIGGPSVLVSGSVLYDTSAGTMLAERPLASDDALRAVRAMREAVPGVIFACARDGTFDHEPGYRPGVPIPADSRVADALELAAEPMWKLIMLHPELDADAMFERARAALGPLPLLASSGGPWVELLADGAGKQPMLAHLCDRLGIGSDEVVAFGDLPIDAEMLAWAGIGIAPANAHPQILAAADEVTGACEDDGVAGALERLLDAGGFG